MINVRRFLKRGFIPIYLLMLIAFWSMAWVGLFTSSPGLAAVGLLISTSAPLAFFIALHVFKRQRTEAHPVWVSSLSGLGAVMIMAAIYRYGDQHSIWMSAAIATLVGWMLYLKVFKLQTDASGLPNSEQNELE